MSEVIPNVGTPFHKTCPHDNKMTHKHKFCFADIKKIKMYCMHNKCNIFSSCSLPGNELDPPPPPPPPGDLVWLTAPPPPQHSFCVCTWGIHYIPSVCAHDEYITYIYTILRFHVYVFVDLVKCVWPPLFVRQHATEMTTLYVSIITNIF